MKQYSKPVFEKVIIDSKDVITISVIDTEIHQFESNNALQQIGGNE